MQAYKRPEWAFYGGLAFYIAAFAIALSLLMRVGF